MLVNDFMLTLQAWGYKPGVTPANVEVMVAALSQFLQAHDGGLSRPCSGAYGMCRTARQKIANRRNYRMAR